MKLKPELKELTLKVVAVSTLLLAVVYLVSAWTQEGVEEVRSLCWAFFDLYICHLCVYHWREKS